MNREELQARVADLEAQTSAQAGCVSFHEHKLSGLVEKRDNARAELAAMPKEPRRCTVAYSDEGRLQCVWLRSDGIERWIAKNGGTYCEMIEVMPASEEVLRMLRLLESEHGTSIEERTLARELRARLPTP